MFTFLFIIFILFCPSYCIANTAIHNRRILHQPLFFTQGSSPPTQPPSLPPEPVLPRYPFTSTTNKNIPFFPSVLSPPPPSQPQEQQPQQTPLSDSPPNSLTTLPANISSLLLPHYPHSNHHSPNVVLVVFVVIVSVLAFLFVAALVVTLRRRRRRRGIGKDVASGLDSHRLYPANTAHSDGQESGDGGSSSAANSSEFLYLGTLVTPPCGAGADANSGGVRGGGAASGDGSSPYQKLGSPELHPLPPLARTVHQNCYRNANVGSSSCSLSSSSSSSSAGEAKGEQFYSPKVEIRISKSISNSPSHCDSPNSLASSNGSIKPVCLSSSEGLRLKSPPEPPLPVSTLPPNPQRLWEVEGSHCGQIPGLFSGPPVLVAPSGSVGFLKRTAVDQAELPRNPVVIGSNEEAWKPKLRSLHEDKVKESSDHLKPSTLKFDEGMIEPFFDMNTKNSITGEITQHHVPVPSNLDNTVLDMKKSQNIAILLRALNMTTEEVCQALLEGNTGTLGTDLLGTLLRMAPTRDEESKLKEYKNDSLYNLGPAEQFLRAVLDIPFAFKRLDAMLYIANFDSEVEYLRMSFEILKTACEELRNSRMFPKFLQAMLNTGNRINVATNSDVASTCELETLLKLVDIKGPDGKTTLLNFVLKELTIDEGYYLSSADQISTDGNMRQFRIQDDVGLGKLKWKVIDGIYKELTNVKKAADMDYDALSNDVSELVCGIRNVGEVVQLNEATGTKESNQRFSESMNKFLKKAEGEITRIQAHESTAFSSVKKVTAYFRVTTAKKEADPFRIFRVVTDFLSILNQACKEVEKNNEQTVFTNINTSFSPIPTPAEV